MQILSRRLCLFFIFCSVFEFYKRSLDYFLGFVFMEALTVLDAFLNYLGSSCSFGCGILVFGRFKPVLELFGLFLLFGFGLKVLNFSWYCKGLGRFVCDFGGKQNLLGDVFCAKVDFVKKCECDPVISSSRYWLLRYVKNINPSPTCGLEKPDFGSNADNKSKLCPIEDCENDKSEDNGDQEHNDEDLELDVVALRKLVQYERRRANTACLELEKERLASATAAEETMAMMLRLQNEKSLIEMEANQYRRLAEEKQFHDQEVIHSLQWLVLKHESERALLEDQLKLYQQRLNLFVEDDECQQFEKADKFMTPLQGKNCIEYIDFDTSLFSSLDLDLSLE